MTVDVVLRFTDEEEAKQFVSELIHPDKEQLAEATVVAIEKVPPDYCRCSFKKGKQYIRGKIYGWHVCPNCYRVTKRVFDNFGVHTGSNNLLPDSLRLENRGPEVRYSSPKEWSFLNG